jgi:MFS family permease
MAYITPLSMVARWFPDRKGLATGFVAGGFGLGAFLYTELVPRLGGFHSAAAHASAYLAAQAAAAVTGVTLDPAQFSAAQTLTAGDVTAVMHVFVGSGVLFLIVALSAAALFCDPPRDYGCAGQSGVHGRCDMSEGADASIDYSPAQVLTTPQFYLLWLQLFINVIAGIAIISNAVFILSDLTGRSAATLAPLFGLISIFNVLGRLFWGALSDRIGCNHTFAAMFALQALMLLVLAHSHSLAPALASVAVILFCCGGGFGTMPAFNAQYFGLRFMGRNYGLLLTAWGFAGLAGPLLVARIKDMTGSFAAMLPVFALLLLGSVIIPFVTRKPRVAAAAAARRDPGNDRSGFEPVVHLVEQHQAGLLPIALNGTHRSAPVSRDLLERVPAEKFEIHELCQ